MSDASHSGPRPGTWKPLAGAGAAAVLVLAIALSTAVFGDRLTDTEEATIEACEAEYARTDGVPIIGGNIYVPTETREYYAVAETHGEVPEPFGEVADEVLATWDAAGQQWINSAAGPVVLVWRHEDDTYSQCNVEFTATGLTANSVQIGPLAAPAHD